MYAKIFSQIFDSSIAKDWQTRHVFMDLLVLADKEGLVDMTHEAIARRTNVPEPVVRLAVSKLCKHDKRSRSDQCDGARLEPLDDRGWGWRIVNYQVYRNLRDENARREYMRSYMRTRRARKQAVNSVNSCKQRLAHTEADTDTNKLTPLKPPLPSRRKRPKAEVTGEQLAELLAQFPSLDNPLFLQAWESWVEYRRTERKPPVTARSAKMAFKLLAEAGNQEALRCIEASIASGYRGLFPRRTKAAPPGKSERDKMRELIDGDKT